MNIFSKEFGTAMLVLLIVFVAVFAVCGIATLITKIAKKDVTFLTKILAGVFAVILLGTTIFYLVQLFPAFKEDKSLIGLIIGNRLIELAIGLMMIILIIENTKNHWLGFVLAILPAAYSIYVLVTNFAEVAEYTTRYMKVQSYVEYIGNAVVYLFVMVFGFLNLIKVIKDKKKAILFAMIPAIAAALCFVIKFAFLVKEYPDDLVIVTAFDALKRSLMLIWCYAMVAKSGNAVAVQAVNPQPMPNPMPNPQPMVQPVYQKPQGFQPQQPTIQAQQAVQQPVQPVMQPQQAVQPAAPVVDNAPKFDPVTGQPLQASGNPTERLAN